jgi:hypothetical protein
MIVAVVAVVADDVVVFVDVWQRIVQRGETRMPKRARKRVSNNGQLASNQYNNNNNKK